MKHYTKDNVNKKIQERGNKNTVHLLSLFSAASKLTGDVFDVLRVYGQCNHNFRQSILAKHLKQLALSNLLNS